MDSKREAMVVPFPRDNRRTSIDRHFTVGVEEEFVLVDRHSRRTVPTAQAVLTDAADTIPGLQAEFTQYQVEICTPICDTMGDIRSALSNSRRMLGTIAAEHEWGLVASGAPVLIDPGPPPVTDNQRYHDMRQKYGALTYGFSICGCHIHVGISDPEEKIRASNYLRAWLPVLLALSVNSPFSGGENTEYASWRYLMWAQWPTAGPPPLFSSAKDYDRELETQINAGAALDKRMAYWDIRLSQQHPTVEIRICDVLPTVDEAVLIAALTRALVATALASPQPPLPRSQSALRAASWRSARDGFEGIIINPIDGRILPATMVVKQLIELVEPALIAAGDLELVVETVAALISKGSGARRQREAYAKNGRYTDVVDLLIAQTEGEIGLL